MTSAYKRATALAKQTVTKVLENQPDGLPQEGVWYKKEHVDREAHGSDTN